MVLAMPLLSEREIDRHPLTWSNARLVGSGLVARGGVASRISLHNILDTFSILGVLLKSYTKNPLPQGDSSQITQVGFESFPDVASCLPCSSTSGTAAVGKQPREDGTGSCYWPSGASCEII